MLSVAVFHADGSGGIPGAVRTALGLTTGEFVDVVAGKRAMTMRVTPQIGLKAVQANWATVGCKAVLYLDDATNARAKLLAAAGEFSSGQTGLVIGVNTSERDASLVPIRDIGRLNSPIAGRTYSNVIIDGRAMTDPAIACERVNGLTFDNVWVVGGMGAGLGTAEAAAQAAVVYCNNTRWVRGGFLGGRGSAQLGIVGGRNHSVTGASFGTDAGTFWNGLMVVPGNIQQNEETVYRALTAADQTAWETNQNLRRWATGTTLIGLIMDQRAARLNRVEGGTNRVTVTWSQYQTMYTELGGQIPGADLAGIPLSEREWWVKVGNGAVQLARFISGTFAGGQAILELPAALPAGTHDIGWYACLPAYHVRGVMVQNCRGWADPASQPNGDLVTLYHTDGFAVEGCEGENYKDRIYGSEHSRNGVFERNVARNAGGFDIEPVTFFGMNIVCRNNVAADIAIVAQGCPVINCAIECPNVVTDDRPGTPGTWETALSGSTTIHRSRNVEMFSGVQVRASNRIDTVTSGDVCRVLPASRPAGVTPALPAPV